MMNEQTKIVLNVSLYMMFQTKYPYKAPGVQVQRKKLH
jgi:ubiquitin-protein ligase